MYHVTIAHRETTCEIGYVSCNDSTQGDYMQDRICIM